ncbi:GNAT family acetyltransferase [Salinarimonas sp. NSM]|uniref:GNAT family acetyltransferase n=1 Tax=Salinarimonas sp. NSM TaxID=3458003 RepID=UPI004035D920
MKTLYSGLALAYFVVATISIMLLAFLLVASALWRVWVALPSGDVVDPVLEGIGLLIIGFAVVETAKFIAEEEILRRRELRSAVESRRSLTKFITIIVIAASLEALVMVFKTSRASIPDAIYPAALFVAAMSALVALGGYQWLSSRINPEIPPDDATGEGRANGGDAEDDAP